MTVVSSTHKMTDALNPLNVGRDTDTLIALAGNKADLAATRAVDTEVRNYFFQSGAGDG